MFTIIMCLLGIIIVGVLLRFMLWPLLKFAAQFIKWVVFTLWAIPILIFLPMFIPVYLIIIAFAALCEVLDLETDAGGYSPSCAIMEKLDEINAKL